MINIKNTIMETVKRNEMEENKEVTFSEMGSKHLQNILYGVWEDDYEEETLLYSQEG